MIFSTFKKRGIYLIFFILLFLNVLTIINSFNEREFDLNITGVKKDNIDGMDKYSIYINTTKSVNGKASLKMIYEDGSLENNILTINKSNKKIHVTGSKPLEMLHIKNISNFEENNPLNNYRIINSWSEGIRIFDAYSMPDYNYLIDRNERVWIVSAGRDSKKTPLKVYLTLLDFDGTVLIYKKLISEEGVFSNYPVIRLLDDSKVHVLWCSKDENGWGYLVHRKFEYQRGQLKEYQTEKILDQEISFEKIVVNNNNVLVSGQKSGHSYFTLYQLKANHIKKIAVFDSYPYTESGMVDHFGFINDSQGNYIIIQAKIVNDEAQYNLTKISPEGQVILQLNDFYKTSAASSKINLKVLAKGDYFLLLYTEFFGSRVLTSKVAYTLFDNNGNIIKEKEVLDGPYAVGICGQFDEKGFLHLTWSKKLKSYSGNNYELVYARLDPDLNVQVPAYIISKSQADKFSSAFKKSNQYRYIIWREFQDDCYQLVIKSTNPHFKSKVPKVITLLKNIFRNCANFIISEGVLFINMIFYNIFPSAIMTMLFILFYSTRYLQKNLIYWITLLLALLLFQFTYIDQSGFFQFLSSWKIDKSITILFLVQLIGFWLLNRKNISCGRNFTYIMGWILVNSLMLGLIKYNYQMTIPGLN